MSTETTASLKAKLIQLEQNYKAERAQIEKQIADTQKAHQTDAIAKIRSLMEEHGLTAEHFQSPSKKWKPKSTKVVAAKYRGPEGQTWTGRGRQPKWLGEDKNRYLIK